MKRYTLTESNLRNLIRESIKNVLREADENSYGGDGNFRHDYRIGAHGYVTGSVNMPDDKIKDPSNVRWRNPYLGDTDSNRMHKDLEDMNKKERNNMRRADKRWQKSADSRPLHRKGAAQRDLMDDVNEGIVRRMIREAVKSVLREGGHLYHKDEDGNVWTNSKETYRGVPGSTYIWHGEWVDPEILWHGVELNANDVEEGLYYAFKDACSDDWDREEFEKSTGKPLKENEQCYEEWLKWMGTEWIASQLDDYVWAMNGGN